MTIDEFEAKALLIVAEFFRDYRENSHRDSSNWPLELSDEEWDDQFEVGVMGRINQ